MHLSSSGLVLQYSVGKAAFRVGPVELHLGPGCYHLQGRNGVGKSTLLRGLCGGLPPVAGRVEVDGVGLERVEARAKVALLPARPSLPPFFTVDEAWSFTSALRGVTWDGTPWREALGLPGGLTLSQASDGQARKAELVAALAGDPPILLLDEPLALLDPASVAVLSRWVEEWRKTRVVLITSHEPLPFEVDESRVLARGEPLDWTQGKSPLTVPGGRATFEG